MADTGIRAVFAASLTREREARDWTQAQLARKAGVSPATVCLVESRACGASLETAAMLARALGIPLAVMVSGETAAAA